MATLNRIINVVPGTVKFTPVDEHDGVRSRAVDVLLDAAVDLEDHGRVTDGRHSDVEVDDVAIRAKSLLGALKYAVTGSCNGYGGHTTWSTNTGSMELLILQAVCAVIEGDPRASSETRWQDDLSLMNRIIHFNQNYRTTTEDCVAVLRAAAYLVRGDFD